MKKTKFSEPQIAFISHLAMEIAGLRSENIKVHISIC